MDLNIHTLVIIRYHVFVLILCVQKSYFHGHNINSTIRDPAYVDPFRSLIISFLVLLILLPFNFQVVIICCLNLARLFNLAYRLEVGWQAQCSILYHGQAFPVPKIHEDTIIKEVERLCKLGVLERQPASEWASPSFIIGRSVEISSQNRHVNSWTSPIKLWLGYHH